jgi:hypothetical protein
MGTDPRKRQKKQERKAAKRKEKKHELVRQQHLGLADRISAAARYPVLQCFIPDSLEDQGIGWVLLSRELPGGQVAVVTFLVDTYCLGVKDVVFEVLGRSAYESKYARKLRTEIPSHSAEPAEACKLLTDAVAYARGIGLPPHPDYAKATHFFAGINPADSNAQFQFGKDGKPFFVGGPRDTQERCERILAILNRTCGPDGFHFLLPAGPHGFGSDHVGPDGEFIDLDDEDYEDADPPPGLPLP